MYSTCIFCNRPLGENTVIEEFPIGRRIAFDAGRGRLWVVCGKCERWNLSPLEERWEAIESAERLFRGTRMRVSTEHIGLARHAEGLELVRIGNPLRPEFAAWRYGDQFGRRRRRAYVAGAAVIAVIGTVATAGLLTGAIGAGLLGQSGTFVNVWMNGRVMLKVQTESGRVLRLKRPDLAAARLRRDSGDVWSLMLMRKGREATFTGEEAKRVAGLIMPKINAGGAGAKVVQEAVREIERNGGPEAYLPHVIGLNIHHQSDSTAQLGKLDRSSKLALEMALHEEHERRALEGELAVLESAWRAAEEIAGIADDLLVTDDARTFIEQKRTD